MALLGVVALALVCGSAAHAVSLAIFPSDARLESAADTQRLVVVLTRDDGVTEDVTKVCTVSFAQDGIAAWGDDAILRPATDGETVATFTHGEYSVTAPITVTNSGIAPKMSFRNDVVPVFLRSGCNAGACHGSAQGKNGFRLSLFGYDPTIDYVGITRELRSRRINIALPEESLMLQKPSGQVAHEGGQVVTPGGHLYEIMEKWIAEGVQDDPADLPALTSIEILPRDATLEGEGAQQRFVVMANYSDGANRDVTDLAILSSSDDQTLTVTGDGVSSSVSPGEAYVMARYGSFALVSQIIVIPAGVELQWPDVQAHNYIDEFVFDKLKKLRVPPAELCSDPVFLRRAYLDVLGTLPTVTETEAFLADESADKRAKLIDQLLERPEFANVWAMKWAEVLRVQATPNVLDVKGMHRYNDWLRHAIANNTPMDQLVVELLSAEGGNFTNPAANYFIVESDPNIIAENVAQVFMGIQMKCAHCHNHPFERWTMDDYYSFSAFFAQIGRKNSSDPREKIVFNSGTGEVKNLRDGKVMAPKFLGGDVPDVSGKDRRAVLAAWLTGPENPWFAKNIANRVWAHFMGAGIVEPADDVRVTNPPANPLLLDELGRKTVAYKYDLRQLVRDICNSYTYQMSTRPRDPEMSDDRNFAQARVRRLSSEQLLDAILCVTDTEVKFSGLPLGARPVEVAGGDSGNYFLKAFGRPTRETVSTRERVNDPTLAQSLHLVNGDTIDNAIKKEGGRLDTLLKEETPPAEIVDRLYLAALARKPSDEERQTLVSYIDQAEDKRAALEDAFWSVLNSKEFVFNH